MSQTSCHAYIYHPLDHVDSIRLLELMPGSKGSPLSCNLKEVQRSHNPAYEALSYAWGEPKFSQTIEEVSSGTHLNITVNLYNALQGIRLEDASRVLWVDSICINQLDLTEKGHQVASMGSIFGEASRVIVWLGCHNETPGSILDILEEFCDAKDEYQYTLRMARVSDVTRLKAALRKLFASQFFQQSWFNRIWVVQEFALAQDLQFISTHDIIHLDLLLEVSNSLLAMELHEFSYDDSDDMVIHLMPLRRVARLISQLYDCRQKQVLQIGYRSGGNRKSNMSLVSCLTYLSRGRQCSDDRDRVYSMLALTDGKLRVIPDYSLSLSDILNDLALQSLHSGDLSMLHASGIRPNYPANSASFVPIVKDVDGIILLMPLDAAELHFSAATQHTATVRPIGPKTVSLRGLRVDTLLQTIDVPTRDWKDGYYPSLSDFTDWLDPTQNELETPDSHTVSSSSRVPKARRPLHWPQSSGPSDIYAALISLGTEKYSDLYHISEKEKVFRPYIEHRRIFQTIQGYLGVGPEWMEPDDQVVIFDGGVTPFILRKVATKSGETGEKWQLVGDCFLLGWMHGDYFGYTVVDEILAEAYVNEQDNTDGVKYLIRGSFVLV